MGIKTKEEALAYLQSEAEKRGKTLSEFIKTDIKELLEEIWAIQQKTGKPVPIEALLSKEGQS